MRQASAINGGTPSMIAKPLADARNVGRFAEVNGNAA
jgi:hypothetical protein